MLAAQELGINIHFEGKGESEIAIVDKVLDNKTPGITVGQVIVRIDQRYFRPSEVDTLLGDPTKAKEKLGWMPEIQVKDLCREMVLADLDQARRNALLKANGFKINISLE